MEAGELDEAKHSASLLLDASVQRLYFHRDKGTLLTPWYIQLDYMLHTGEMLDLDTNAQFDLLQEVAKYRQENPSDYLNSNAKMKAWLKGYLPADTSGE